MKLKPLADRVLISPAPAETQTASGIIIPDEGKEDEKMILKAGDQVLYGKYAGTEIEFEGEKYLIMRQSDVVAVIEK